MSKAILAVVVIGIVAMVVLLAWRRKPSFREYVTGPEGFGAARRFKERQELTIPDDVDGATIEKWVKQLLRGKDAGFAEDRLKLAGQRAVPALLGALDEPQLHKSESPFGTISPLCRVLRILETIRPREAIGAVTKLIEHEDEDVRKEAALTLGSIADAECIPGVQRALSDEDDYVRSYAMMGIRRAREAERGMPEFFDAMVDPLVRLLDRDSMGASDAPHCLLAVAQERGVAAMLDERFFQAENRALVNILKALNDADAQIPKEWLHRLVDSCRGRQSEYPLSYTLGQALIALGRMKDGAAEKLAREFINAQESRVREDAALALCRYHGLGEPANVVYGREGEVGFENLTEPQKHVYCVNALKAEVDNGGFAQYFFNSAGDHTYLALEALKAIDAPDTAGLLQRANDLFGEKGPSRDRGQRVRQLSRMKRKHDAEFERLDSAFYEDPDHLGVRVCLYAIEHKVDFQQAS